MDAPRTPEVVAFWEAFRAAALVRGEAIGERFEVVSFDLTQGLADTLAELVVAGRKRATAGLLRSFTEHGEAPPELGGHVVLVDGRGRPRAIWRTTDLRTGLIDSVDDAFAWDEGEGDRSRAYWLEAHRDFFARACAAWGEAFDADTALVVFERFRIVWPPGVADPPG